ncbi:MAG: outer membrane protein assembly factor BamD [Opitutaceae bacterium]|jgi:outer membrane protein assembly factor BamD|nr:outer membrane protein assembly factor BamD [Opitutaceae bacterium]
MTPVSIIRPAIRLLLLAITLAIPGRLAAELVWTPENGWKIEGGILSGLVGKEGSNALGLMNEAREGEEKGKIRSSIKDYERVGKRFTNSIYAPEALFRAARLQRDLKKYNKSFNNFQTVVSRYPNTTRFDEIIGEQYSLGASLLNGARGRFLWVFPGFANRERGIQFLETVIFNAPYSNYAPLALLDIAHAHHYLGETAETLYALDRLVNNYGNSILSPDAYLKLGETYASLVDSPYHDQGATKEAVTYFEDFMILYPGDNQVPAAEKGLAGMKTILAESKIKIADFYFHRRDNYQAARVFYNEAITIYPDSPVAASARSRLVEVEAAAAKAAVTPQQKKRRPWAF